MTEEIEVFPATVVRVIDDSTLVINRGAKDGVSKGDSFLVYFLEPEELKDPSTGESLGHLEIVRGSGSVEHVQEKMATIKSNRTEPSSRVVRRPFGVMASLYGETIEEPVRNSLPFEEPQVGDMVKPV